MVANDDKQYYIPKKLLGELISVLAKSTDPANILGFTSIAISTTRAIMIKMIENQMENPDVIGIALQTILVRMAGDWERNGQITPDEMQEIEKMLKETFKSESAIRYNLELWRDVLFCEDMYRNWKHANIIYVQRATSWAESNAILSEIHKQLFEIMIRHNLISMPMQDSFNLDERGTETGRIEQMLAKIVEGRDDT